MRDRVHDRSASGHDEDDVRVHVIAWPPDFPTSACYELVVAIDDGVAVRDDHGAIDAWTTSSGRWTSGVSDSCRCATICREPWAPRRQVAELAAPRPTWPTQARFCPAAQRALGHAALRIDHIGSTSVPGLPAKDLIDIQVVVPDLDVADGVAAHVAMPDSFLVPGRWSGPDRDGRQYEEVVLVDADPGRPVNVNLRPVGDPVWRETLLFRDWLIGDAVNQDRYLAFKQHLVETRTTSMNTVRASLRGSATPLTRHHSGLERSGGWSR